MNLHRIYVRRETRAEVWAGSKSPSGAAEELRIHLLVMESLKPWLVARRKQSLRMEALKVYEQMNRVTQTGLFKKDT